MFILLLDLDQTIVGDVSFLAYEYYLIQQLRSKGEKVKIDKQRVSEDIKNHIRPYVKQFLDIISPHALIFIYTASNNEWAQFVVPYVEKYLDHKFERPIFTRKDTINEGSSYSKRLGKVQGKMTTALSRKGVPKRVLHNCIFIDDNPQLILDKERVIPATSYTYYEPFDILRNVPKDIIIKHQSTIVELLGLQKGSLEYFFQHYYAILSNQFAQARQLTSEDVFFKELTPILYRYSTSQTIFTKVPSIVQRLQNRQVI